jgi:serine/threonine protein kinase
MSSHADNVEEQTICDTLHSLEQQRLQLEKQIDEVVEKIVNEPANSSHERTLANLEVEETRLTESWLATHRNLLALKQRVRKQITSKQVANAKATLQSYRKLVRDASGSHFNINMQSEEVGDWEIPPSEVAIISTDRLGAGAYGSVYRGVLRGKEVAVKKFSYHKAMNARALSDLRKEVSVMVKLRHPNILLFMGGCTVPGQYSIVTELMPNGSIADLLKKKSDAITFRQRLRFLKDAALGMNWLHCSDPPILHFDLKPENLLVDANLIVKVADFGLSHLKNKDSDDVGQIGSPLYMAPELFTDSSKFSESCDVYSFGICMCEILTGEEPYKGAYTTIEGLKNLVLSGKRPPIPATFPQRIKDLIEQCVRADAAKRPTFADILQTRVLDKAVIDCTISAGNWIGREMWDTNFCGSDSVKWDDFLKIFMHALGKSATTLDTLCLECLKSILEKADTVHIDDFARMLEYFGPIEKNDSVLQRMMSVCFDLKGFWGEASTEEAQKALSVSGFHKGTYLIRFSSSDPGSYSVTTLDKKEKAFRHYRIIHKSGSPYVVQGCAQGFKTLQEAIGSMKELKHPCPNSKYDQLKKNVAMQYSAQAYMACGQYN